ncbi:MAG: hypothetical protein ACI3XQ_09650, partial [Eubacteriales bacterium]
MNKTNLKSKLTIWISILLCFSTLLLCACGGSKENVDSSSPSGSEDMTEENKESSHSNAVDEDPVTPEEPALDLIALTFGNLGNGVVKQNSKAPFELDDETGIVTVKHGGTDSLYNAAKYCVLLQFADPSELQAKYKYVRVLYSAKNPEGADAVAFKIRDNAAGGASDVTIATVTDDTDGFVLSNAEQMAVSSLSRLLQGNYDTWLFETDLEGGEYCIRGVYFFRTFEEAQTMTVEYADKLRADAQKKADEEAANKTLVSMSFTEDGNAAPKINEYTANKIEDGVITVTRSESAIYTTTRYMTMPQFKSEKEISVKHKYVRILYSAENPNGLSSVPMLLRATASGETVTVLSGTYNTNGYALTNTVQMSTGIISAFVLKNDVGIIFDTNTDGGTYRIKGLYFFETQEEANEFTVKDAVNVGNPKGVNPGDANYPCLSLGAGGSCAFTNTKNTNYQPDVDTGSIKINYSGVDVKEWDSTRYLIKVKFPYAQLLTKSYKYVRIAYKASNPSGDESVDLVLRTDGTGDNDIVVATVTAATDGFVLSNTIELNDKLLDRWIEGNHNSLFFKTSNDGGEYYILGIYFYDSEEKANSADISNI